MPLVAAFAHGQRRRVLNSYVYLDGYTAEYYRTLGLSVKEGPGGLVVSTSVGTFEGPTTEDYEYWAKRWGTSVANLRDIDGASLRGDLTPLRDFLFDIKQSEGLIGKNE